MLRCVEKDCRKNGPCKNRICDQITKNANICVGVLCLEERVPTRVAGFFPEHCSVLQVGIETWSVFGCSIGQVHPRMHFAEDFIAQNINQPLG